MNPLNHVAIIMDGNGRWGLAKNNSRNFGHKEGLRTVEKIIQSSINENIKYLTLYVFSIDNWKRPKNETEYLFSLLESFLKKKISQINSKNIKLCFLGNKKLLNLCVLPVLIRIFGSGMFLVYKFLEILFSLINKFFLFKILIEFMISDLEP